MTFNQVIWKMAKVQYKKYLFYYLCNSFAVMFFFMFSTVYFNNQIEKAKQLDGIQDALSIPGVALIVFTIFFINLAHNVFMKRRRSEFGLFMILGMTRRDISRLLVLENAAIAAASIVTGFVAGAIFSRLFFMLLMNWIGLQEVAFHVGGKMFMYSLVAFLVVFFFAVANSLFLASKNSVLISLKSDRISQAIKMKSPFLGFFGLALMVGCLLALYITYVDSDGGLLPLCTLGVLVGLYISLNQFSSFVIEATKKLPGFYLRRMFFLTSLDYKFKQLTSIIMLVSVMTMITILYSSLLLTFYKSSEKDAISNNPYDVAFYQTETKNNLPEEKLYAVFGQGDHPIEEHLVIPVLTYYQKHPYAEGFEVYQIMGLKDFNKVTSANEKLKDKEYLVYFNTEREYGEVDVNPFLELTIDNRKIDYEFKGKSVQKAINLLPNTHEFIIVNENEFNFLTNSLNAYKSKLHLINLNDWKGSSSVVEELEEKFEDFNHSSAPIEDKRTEFISEKEQFRVASKVADYNNIRSSSGIMFFVTTFLTIMFFLGTFILLYLNLFSEIEEEKAKYRKLYKIGITLKEVKKYISSELITIFFAPTLIGTVLAAIYMVILSTDVGGIMHNLGLLFHFCLISSIYLAIQNIYYFYLRNKIMRHLIGKV